MNLSTHKRLFRLRRAGLLLSLLLLIFPTRAAFGAADEAKRLLALIDYIGGDYRNAIDRGTIVSADEYAEMTEFSKESVDVFGRLKKTSGDKAGIESDLHALVEHIRQGSGDEEVPRLAAQSRNA
jgi:high-affinity iron transporter